MATLPHHRTVADVMTSRVHVASPATPFKLLVRLIEENRISAVPIVNQHGVPVGVVSESDLLLKESHVARRRQDRVKAEAVVAADLMTSPAITVQGDAFIGDAARLMQERNVRRLVVVDSDGRIAGIVSRSDLLQIFLRTDEDLREELVGGIIPAIVPNDVESVEVDVQSSVITLAGEVDRRSDAQILVRMARQIDGAVDVIDRLHFRWDDLKRAAGG